MSTRPQPPIPPEGEGPPLAPYSPSAIRTLFTGTDIWWNLGRLDEAVKTLQITTKSHGEKLQETIRQVDRVDYAQSVVRDAMALQGDRIRALEKISHFAQFVAALMIGGGI